MAQDLGLHVNLLDLFRGAGTPAAALVNEGAIKFAFNYTTGSNLWTDDRRAALEKAADAITAYLLVTEPVTLTYDVSATNSPEEDILASAGSGYQFRPRLLADRGPEQAHLRYRLQRRGGRRRDRLELRLPMGTR